MISSWAIVAGTIRGDKVFGIGEFMVSQKSRNSVSLVVLLGVYLLCSLRYFPGSALKTVVETLLQIVTVAPIPGGATLILVNFLQRSAKEKMPWDRMARIYLTIGLMVEFIFGVHHYLSS